MAHDILIVSTIFSALTTMKMEWVYMVTPYNDTMDTINYYLQYVHSNIFHTGYYNN